MTTAPIAIFRRQGITWIQRPDERPEFHAAQYGGWDVWCHVCRWTGTHPYPTDRTRAFELAAEHLRGRHA